MAGSLAACRALVMTGTRPGCRTLGLNVYPGTLVGTGSAYHAAVASSGQTTSTSTGQSNSSHSAAA
jgi:hypothetical protein